MDTNTTTGGRTRPWNKGRLLGQRPPLKLKEIWAIRIRLQLGHWARDLALFNLAIDSKLRGCDLTRLRVQDVCKEAELLPGRLFFRERRRGPFSSRSPSRRVTRLPLGLLRRT